MTSSTTIGVICVVALTAVLGAGVGELIRGWLNTLGYRTAAEKGSAQPGPRRWVPVAAGAVSGALAWRFGYGSPEAPAALGPAPDGGAFDPTADLVVVWVVLLVASWACVALAAIDLDVHRLPDRIIGPTLVWLVLVLAVAAVAGAGWGPWWRMLTCGVGSGVFYLALSLVSLMRGSSGLGLGDVKLAVVLGAALGWIGFGSLILGVYAGFLIGGAWALVLLLSRRVKLSGHLAFGPPMMLGVLCALLVPPNSLGSMF
ncbi:MAG: A24 family peptidase [Ornithinimicrobium sp.]